MSNSSSFHSFDSQNVISSTHIEDNNEELKALKTQIAQCSARLREVKEETARQEEYQNLIRDVVRNLEQQIRDEDEKMKPLIAALKLNTDPTKITNRVKAVLEKIQIDEENFKRTGDYVGIDEEIAELREIFNLLVVQLKEFKSNSKFVSKALDALIALDVRD